MGTQPKQELPPVHIDDLEVTPFLRKVTLFSSGGPFLEGYVLGVIGVALVKITPELGINHHWAGLIGVASIIGLFLGAVFGGYLTDRLGRRRMFLVTLVAVIFLSLACIAITNAWQLFILRMLIGLIIGADYPIATSMIIEFTPSRYRAISMGIIAAVWYLGANCAYLVGYFMLDIPNGWRWMLGSCAIPAIIILLGRISIPESPRWLHSKGRDREAQEIAEKIFGRKILFDGEPVVENTKIRKVFQGTYLKRVIFVGTIWLCQAIPMFAIYTYGPQIIEEFGWSDPNMALIGEMIIGSFFLVGTIPAMFLAETLGRRPLIIISFAVMTVALAVLGIVPEATIVVVLACFAVYALFSGGPGNLEWLYPNELFPTDIRASAMGIAMALSRIATMVSIYILPSFMNKYGSGVTMLVGAGISLLGFLISVLMAPETKGLPLSVTGSEEFTRGMKNVHNR